MRKFWQNNRRKAVLQATSVTQDFRFDRAPSLLLLRQSCDSCSEESGRCWCTGPSPGACSTARPRGTPLLTSHPWQFCRTLCRTATAPEPRCFRCWRWPPPGAAPGTCRATLKEAAQAQLAAAPSPGSGPAPPSPPRAPFICSTTLLR